MLHHQVTHAFAVPRLVALKEVRADEPIAGGLIGEDTHDACSAFDLLHEPLHDVGRVDPPAMFRGQVVNGQGLFELLADLLSCAGLVFLPALATRSGYILQCFALSD